VISRNGGGAREKYRQNGKQGKNNKIYGKMEDVKWEMKKPRKNVVKMENNGIFNIGKQEKIGGKNGIFRENIWKIGK
jgi:DNA invertase Pin-like site-specific DNA recombinase